GLVALGMAAGPASAADLAARPVYTKAPPMVAAIYDWSGFYVGINGGWGSSHNCADLTNASGTFLAADGCQDATGGTVGGQLGYRWQANQFVFGLEAQGNWADFSGSHIGLTSGLVDRSRIDSLGLFTGQIGYAWNNALLYLKGGAAVTDSHYDVFTVPGAFVGGTGDQTRWGGVVGVGLEYGFAPNWSAALEYDHLFMGSENVAFSNGAVPAGFDNIRQDVDMITARVNYRFGGPVIGRY
ncbi:outer membrane beta-barrel protein, partial [Bradyrhizobium sp.]|uniref:outer membrane protein n=1 Tax=Bradyrhizobium sp. TaxID=376 RepID=UPI0034414260